MHRGVGFGDCTRAVRLQALPPAGTRRRAARGNNPPMLRIGLVSDTHGLLRPEVLDFLRGSDHILHGGDICGPEVLAGLRELAPVTAVRGNNDRGSWAEALAPARDGALRRRRRAHGARPARAAAAAPARAWWSPAIRTSPASSERGGVLYVNPGSAGPRRFSLPISAGELRIAGTQVTARLVQF